MTSIAIVWLTALLFMSVGTYSIDELIQIAGLSALRTGNGFVVQNGANLFDSEALKIVLLRQGADGLVIQYPSGFNLLAYPFYAVGGVKGVFVLNFFAGVLCVCLTYRIALMMVAVETARIAVLLLSGASFLVDYCAAIWPHTVATAIILLSLFCVIKMKSAEEQGTHPGFWAFLGGLAIGLGLSVRLDVILVAPPILIWTLWYSNRPLNNIGFATFGLLPGLLVCSVLNGLKFGVWLPLSYGRDSFGSATSLDTYLIPLAAMAVIFLGTYILRKVSTGGRRATLGAIALIVAATVTFYDPLTDRVIKVLWGIYFLIFNMANHPETDVRWGVVSYSAQSTLFWGAFKQALGQSLPWLGLLPLAIASARLSKQWKSLVILVSILFSLIFLMQIWHGGKSNTQRYLLPIVPLLSILGALALSEIAERRRSRRLFPGLTMAACFVGLTIAVNRGGLPMVGLIEQPFATVLCTVCAALSIFALIWRSEWIYRFLAPVAYFAIAFSVFSAFVVDLSFSAISRTRNANASEIFRKLPPNTIIYGWAIVGAHGAFENDGQILAKAYPESDPDPKLVQDAFSKGWKIATTRDDLLERIVDLSVGSYAEMVSDMNSQTALWIVYPPKAGD